MNYLSHVIKVSLKVTLVSVFVFVALSYLTNFLGPLKLSLNTKNIDQQNFFSVDGEGTVSVKPDIALVNVGFVVQDLSVVTGQKKANEVINNTTTALKALGITEKDIKTTAYNIYPNYNYLNGKQTLNGYTINIGMIIKVRNFDLLNRVVDSATASGINQISGISFDVENKDDATNIARKEAVKSAKDKAQKLASLAGIKLGRIVNVREGQVVNPVPYLPMSAKAVGGGVADNTQVQPGQTEVKVSVTLDYETL